MKKLLISSLAIFLALSSSVKAEHDHPETLIDSYTTSFDCSPTSIVYSNLQKLNYVITDTYLVSDTVIISAWTKTDKPDKENPKWILFTTSALKKVTCQMATGNERIIHKFHEGNEF
jgi:hypothetical protein